MLDRLYEAIDPFCSVEDIQGPATGPSSAVTVTYRSFTTPEQRAFGDQVLTAFDWSQPAHDAWVAALRQGAERIFSEDPVRGDPLPLSKCIRSVGLIALDEFNIVRQWIMSFKAAVAAATTLADLKTRVAALPNTPDRTPTQFRNAMRNRIGVGDVDN